MAAWAAGSAVLFIVLAAVTAYLVWYYARRDVAWPYLALVALTWYFGFFGALFIPVDLATTYDSADGPPGMQKLWLAVYWTTFVITWLIIPLVNEYQSSGFYHWQDGVLSSLRSNLIQYVVMIVLGTVFVVWVLASHRLTASQLPDFAVVAATAYGMIFVAALGGYGLIELPRWFWRSGDAAGTLRRLQFQAPEAENAAYEARQELEAVLADVRTAHARIPQDGEASSPMQRELRLHINAVLETARIAEHEGQDGLVLEAGHSSGTSSAAAESAGVPDLAGMSASWLASVNRRMIFATSTYCKARYRWVGLVRNCASIQSAMEEGGSGGPPLGGNAAAATGRSQCQLLGDWFNWYWQHQARPWVMRGAAVICVGISLVLLWSEAVAPLKLAPKVKANLSLVSVITNGADAPGWRWILGQLFYGYLSMCVYYGLFQLRPFAFMDLLGGKQTDAYALLFNAMYLCRLQFSLAFNYIAICRFDQYHGDEAGESRPHTAFQASVGSGSTLSGVDFGLCAVFALAALLTALDCQARMTRFLGFDHLASEPRADSSEDDTVVREGQSLVRREMKRLGNTSMGGMSGGALAGADANADRGMGASTPLSSADIVGLEEGSGGGRSGGSGSGSKGQDFVFSAAPLPPGVSRGGGSGRGRGRGGDEGLDFLGVGAGDG